MDPCMYDDFLNFFLHDSYPKRIVNIPDASARKLSKRSFRSAVKPYQLKDGMLEHNGKIVLRQSQVRGVLEQLHSNSVFGGHLGRDRTKARVAEKYYWKGHTADIIEFVASCEQCQTQRV